MTIPTIILGTITMNWFGYFKAGAGVGAILGAFVLHRHAPRFLVSNNAHQALVTTNPLARWLKSSEPEDAYVTYGPAALEISYPWEHREEENNVSLEVATESVSFTVVVTNGQVRVRGSYRLRAAINRLARFIGLDVSTIVVSVADFVQQSVWSRLSQKTTSEALATDLGKLNTELSDIFRNEHNDVGLREIFRRFQDALGVWFIDVTIAEILPPEEQMKTRMAQDEAAAVAIGTAKYLGYENVEEMKQARRDGEIDKEDVHRARERFLAVSENIKMDVKVHELRGLESLVPVLNAAREYFQRNGGKNDGGAS